MLSRVDVTNNQGNTLTLNLADISSGYLVEDIEGLDPVKATVVTSSFATMDGVQAHSTKREARNLIFHLKYEPDYATDFVTVRQLRSALYAYFMPKSRVKMRFYSDDLPDLVLYGIVETFPSPLFTQDPKATITVLCENPDFVNEAINVFNGTSVTDTTETLLTYGGTVDTGFSFRMSFSSPSTGFTIYMRASDGTLSSMGFSASLLAGDVVTISTVPGSKGATLTRGGSDTSILYGISPYAAWLTLTPGANFVRVVGDSAAIPYSISYSDRYGGL